MTKNNGLWAVMPADAGIQEVHTKCGSKWLDSRVKPENDRKERAWVVMHADAGI